MRRGSLPLETECEGCPLAVDGKPNRPVRGTGPDGIPKFIVVGESPTVGDTREGLPFTGKPGQILGKALATSGIARNDVFITNTVLCCGPRNPKEDVVAKAAKFCRNRLIRDLDIAPDVPILAVGKQASTSLISKNFKLSELAGTLHTVPLEGLPFTVDVIPTIHPGAMLRGSDNSGAHTSDLLYWFLQYDVAKIARLADGKVELFTDDITIEATDSEVAHRLIEEMYVEGLALGWLACDTETKGKNHGECTDCYDCLGHSALEATRAQLTAIGLSTPARSICVNWAILAVKTKTLLAAMFADKRLGWLFHNNCLTGDTRVWLADGTKLTLAQMVQQKHPGPVITVNEETGKLENKRVVGWVKGPVRRWEDWRRIRVRGKGCLRITVDHEVLTTRGRVEAGKIRLGDKILLHKPALNAAQRAILFGSLLGDASIQLNAPGANKIHGLSRSPYWRVHHSEDQLEYLRFKRAVLSDLAKPIKSSLNARGFSARAPRMLHRFSTARDARLGEVWEATTTDSQKTITTQWLQNLSSAAVAIWFCDDGALSGNSGAAICVTTFDGRGAEKLCAHLEACGWPAKLRRRNDGHLYLYVSGPRGANSMVPGLCAFWESITPFIPPAMRYKVPIQYRDLPFAIDFWQMPSSTVATWDVVTEVGPLLRAEGDNSRYGGYSVKRGSVNGLTQYCLQVEDNKNFFAEGLGVSNCYDRVVLKCNGFPIAGHIDCTMYMHHSAFPGLSHKLQRVASQFMLIGAWKAEHRHGDGTIEELLQYCARDTLATARLRRPLEVLLEKRDAKATYAMDMRKCAMAESMQIAGIPVDIERVNLYMRYFEPKIREAEEALLNRLRDTSFKEVFKSLITLEQAKFTRKADADLFEMRREKRLGELEKKWAKLEKKGEQLFNLDSHPQIVAYLKACGVNLTQVTKKGKISTKKDVLESLIGHPAVRELLEYRTNEKLYRTFIVPLRHKLDKAMRLHSTWSPNKITGRFGSSPNCQNQTKGKTTHKKYETWAAACVLFLAGTGLDPGIPNLRWMYKAPNGRRFVGADYKQLEARLLAMLSGDTWLCNMFINGEDIHSYFANEVFPNFKDLDPASNERLGLRDLAKRLEYGYWYGATVATAWKALMKEGHANLPISTIVRAFKIFEQKMPGIIRYYRQLVQATVERGKVTSFLYGRAEYFPIGGAAEDPTVIKNFGCQAGGSDIADTGILKLHEELIARGIGTGVIIHGHDAAYIEISNEEFDVAKKLMRECMEQTYEIDGVKMIFGVDVHAGESWGEA